MKYDILLADPPFRYESGTCDPKDSIETKYETMHLNDLKSMWFMIHELAAKDCILYMWAMPPKLTEAVELMNAWGFRFRSSAVWDKLSIGLGYWFRQQHESILVGIRGRPHPPEKEFRVSSIFNGKRGKHSEKPHSLHHMIDVAYPDKRKIELFAEQLYFGWDAWGHGVNKSGQIVRTGNK